MTNQEILENMIGKVVLCADGDRRLLEKVEAKYLHYAIEIANGVWRSLGPTNRWEVEADFVNGTIVESEVARMI